MIEAPDPRLELILHHLDPPPGTKLWHGGASVVGSLRGVRAEQAAWRPAPTRHSIWALALHIAYWKYAIIRRVTGGEPGGFERAPSNFPSVPSPATDAAWNRDRALLKKTHRELVDVIRSFDPGRLDDPPLTGGGYSSRDLLLGIILHDTHHAGQIVMLKRLYNDH